MYDNLRLPDDQEQYNFVPVMPFGGIHTGKAKPAGFFYLLFSFEFFSEMFDTSPDKIIYGLDIDIHDGGDFFIRHFFIID